ncbi:MAG: tRNA dihydrouridine synthase DusB, partial [Gemmatimonadota bacterium]
MGSSKYFHAMQLPYPSAAAFPLILAPMAGVSEAPFRQICRRMGADVVMSEFLSSEAIRRRIRTTLEGAEFEPCERPIGIQIYGADPDAMAEAAGLITEHYRPEFIDINFGCPVKKVVQRNGGSGCLRDMGLVERIIRAVVAATDLPVTVKTRSGWNEEQRDPVGIALRMQDAGARALTLHARTRTQMFNGKANWDEIARVVEALDIPVIGNGDIQTPADVVRMRTHTGCAGVMIGRGSFGNPWLFRDARALLDGEPLPPPPDAAERFRVCLEHARLAMRLQGDTRKTVIEFRKHLGWYTRGLYGASDLRQRL